MSSKLILVIDDDPSVNASIAMLLKRNGIKVLLAENPEQALSILHEHNVDLVIQDMNFSRDTSGTEGIELLKIIKQEFAHIPVVLMTAWASISLAVEGMKLGAADFVSKPWDNQQLMRIVKTALRLHTQSANVQISREQLQQQYDFSEIIAEDPAMLAVLSTIARVAATDAPVLILGESGTGKELIANAIHRNSKRSEQALVKVNLGGMSTSLFESEMFGHVKGAFTDAKQDRKGRFELANEGSIFLDEIGDLEPSSQVKLLRVLQDQSYQVVGSSQTKRANVRVICATNRDLHEMTLDGSFREDLLYRINLITINLPPLRERRGDIPRLAQSHLQKVATLYQLDNASIEASALAWLSQQRWPGNVRELCQTVERAALMSPSPVLTRDSFMLHANVSSSADAGENTQLDALPVGEFTLGEVEKVMIEKAIMAYNNNLSKVAEALGISRAALYRRIEKYDLKT